jgi:hypothetical protein
VRGGNPGRPSVGILEILGKVSRGRIGRCFHRRGLIVGAPSLIACAIYPAEAQIARPPTLAASTSEPPLSLYFPRYANEQPKLRAFIDTAKTVLRKRRGTRLK